MTKTKPKKAELRKIDAGDVASDGSIIRVFDLPKKERTLPLEIKKKAREDADAAFKKFVGELA